MTSFTIYWPLINHHILAANRNPVMYSGNKMVQKISLAMIKVKRKKKSTVPSCGELYGLKHI